MPTMTYQHAYRMGLQSPVVSLHHPPHPTFFHAPPISPPEPVSSLLFPTILQPSSQPTPQQPPPPPVHSPPRPPTAVLVTVPDTPAGSSSGNSPPKTQRAPYGAGEDDGFDMKFDNMQQFQEWRAEIEEREMVEFVKGDSHASKAVPPRFKDHTKLVCARHSRSGRKKYIKKYPERQRKVPSRKIEEGCLASISYKTFFDSPMVCVKYSPQHSHDIGVANFPFTKRGRKAGVMEKRKTPTNTPRIQQPSLHEEAMTPSDAAGEIDPSFSVDDSMSPQSLLDSTATISAAVSPSNIPSRDMPLPATQSQHIVSSSSQNTSSSHSLSTPHLRPQSSHLPTVQSQPHSQSQPTRFGHTRPVAPAITLPNSQQSHNLSPPQVLHAVHTMTPISPHSTPLPSTLGLGSQHDTLENVVAVTPAPSPTHSLVLHSQTLQPVYPSPTHPPPGLPPLPAPDISALVNDLQNGRWERMSTLFQALRDQARSHDFSSASLAALESVLVRLFLESPLSSSNAVGPSGNGH